MGQAGIGGGGVKDIFRMKADHSGIVQLGTLTTEGAAATLLTHRSLRLGSNVEGDEKGVETTGITFTEEGAAQVTYTVTKMNPETAAFEDVACPKMELPNQKKRPEKSFENSRKVNTGGVAPGIQFLFIDYGAEADGEIEVNIFIAPLKKTSFGTTYKADEFNMYNVEAVSVAATAAVTIPAAMFDATIVTVAAAQTLPAGKKHHRLFFPVAA